MMVEVGPCRRCIKQHFAKRYIFAGLLREYRTCSQQKHEDAMPSIDSYSSYHTHGGAKTGRHVADRGYRASFVEL